METAVKKSSVKELGPALRRVLIDAENEQRQMKQMFELLGLGHLPEELKFEIRDDIKAYADELNGFYSSCDPYVQRRRESVDFWVRSYCDGLCTLDTAVKSLHIRPL